MYGVAEDSQLPTYLIEDARIPFLGFAGPQYRVGGVVLLGINPGGGGNANQFRKPQDAHLVSLIEAFASSSPQGASKHFAAMSSNYATQLQTWNLWRIFFPVLEACGKKLNHVSFLNYFPYRTANDQRPRAAALRASWTKVIKPLLDELKPSIVVALGKKVGGIATRQFSGPGKLYIVPRTLRDRQVSDEAKVELKRLRRDAT